MTAWPEAACGERVRLERSAEGYAIVRLADGAPVGRIALSETVPATGVIDALCIETSERGYGAGSEAAWLVAEALGRAGVRTLRAWAPPDRGLAVYFWSRMGFRPIFGEGPNGGIWFERRLSDGEPGSANDGTR